MNWVRFFCVFFILWMGSNTLSATLKIAKQLDHKTAVTLEELALNR